MKHLLSGVAIAAALAFALPVWAQPSPNAPPRPGVPSAVAPSASAQLSTSASAPKHRGVRHVTHRAAHSKAHPSRAAGGAGNVANQLNAQELRRIRSGAPPQETAVSPHFTEGYGSSSPPGVAPSPSVPSPYNPYDPYAHLTEESRNSNLQ
jgi:hypothetical protein